jgi:hypothetical protein
LPSSIGFVHIDKIIRITCHFIESRNGSSASGDHDLVAAIQADEVLDVLRRGEMPPVARQLGDTWHAWEGDDPAVFGANAELSRSLQRRACHCAACGG